MGKVLLFLALPFVAVGLIDPLEGGISLIIAGAVYTIAFFVLNKVPPRYLWLPLGLSVIIGIITIVYATATLEFTPGPTDLELPVVIGVWVYRVAVLATLISGILYAVLEVKRTE